MPVQISTVLGAAIKHEREQSAWSEGVAIWVAVIVVSGVGKQLPPTPAHCRLPALPGANELQRHLQLCMCLTGLLME